MFQLVNFARANHMILLNLLRPVGIIRLKKNPNTTILKNSLDICLD